MASKGMHSFAASTSSIISSVSGSFISSISFICSVVVRGRQQHWEPVHPPALANNLAQLRSCMRARHASVHSSPGSGQVVQRLEGIRDVGEEEEVLRMSWTGTPS